MNTVRVCGMWGSTVYHTMLWYISHQVSYISKYGGGPGVDIGGG